MGYVCLLTPAPLWLLSSGVNFLTLGATSALSCHHAENSLQQLPQWTKAIWATGVWDGPSTSAIAWETRKR